MSNTTDTNNDLPFDYVPTEAVTILFVTLFGLTTLVHFFQACYFRKWSFIPTVVLCGIGELIGWSGRLWGALNPENGVAFLMQIASLIISPSLLTAAIFRLLPPIIERLGTKYSRFRPKIYNYVFVSADVVALTVQAAGGGIASSANDQATGNLGGNIALAGIVIQFLTVLIFAACSLEIIIRFYRDQPFHPENEYNRMETYRTTLASQSEPTSSSSLPLKYIPISLKQSDPPLFLLLTGVCIVVILVLIRSVYRTVELSFGWNGPIIATQWLFDAFDGGPIFLALFTLNVLHPAPLLWKTKVSRGNAMAV